MVFSGANIKQRSKQTQNMMGNLITCNAGIIVRVSRVVYSMWEYSGPLPSPVVAEGR